MAKSSKKSRSSHRGEKIRHDFVNENDKLVERNTVREYINEQFKAKVILNIGEGTIDKVIDKFRFNAHNPEKPYFLESCRAQIKGIIRCIIANDRKPPPMKASFVKADDNASGEESREDDDSPMNLTVRTEYSRLLYAGKGDSIPDEAFRPPARHEVSSQNRKRKTADADADANADGDDQHYTPKTVARLTLKRINNEIWSFEPPPQKKHRRKIQYKTVANSGSSHRGKKVGGDFFDENGILVERKTVREYIYDQFMKKEIMTMGDDNIDKVMYEFVFNQEDYRKISRHIIRRIIENGRDQPTFTCKPVAESKQKIPITDDKTEIVHKNVKLCEELQKTGCKELQRTGCKDHVDAYLIDNGEGDSVCEECGKLNDSMAKKWSKSRAGDAENPFLSENANLSTNVKSMDKNRNEITTPFARNIMKQLGRQR